MMSWIWSVDHFSACASHHEMVGFFWTMQCAGTLYPILQGCSAPAVLVVDECSVFGYGSRISSCPGGGTCRMVQPLTRLEKGGIESRSTRRTPPTDMCEGSLPRTP